MTNEKLIYRDSDGLNREIEGCTLTVDNFGRHWIWSEHLSRNLVYKTVGRENALLSTINSLLFTIHLRDEQIKSLQRVAHLAQGFAAEINGLED